MPTTTYQLVCEIAESGSISGAAEKLHLTPSAASHSLNSVEQNAGFLLFNRERGGVTLTREGEHLLPYFRAILGAEIALEEEIMLLNSVEKGKISIGVFNSVRTESNGIIIGWKRMESSVFSTVSARTGFLIFCVLFTVNILR